MSSKKYLKRVFEGALMGMANIIPGVSGGTMALVTGIYDRLIRSINTVPLDAPIILLKGDYENFRKKLKEIDYRFLIPLIVGILIGSLLLARAIEFLLYSYPAATYSFFFGLILSGLGVIYKYIEDIDLKTIFWGVVGFLVAFLIVGVPTLQTSPSLPMVFIIGIFVIISMILPGISGAFILIFLQQYDYMLHALNEFNIPVIATFTAGGAVGLFTFSKFLEYLLERHKSGLMSFLFGLMVGGLRAPGAKVIAIDPPMYEIILPAVAGSILVLILELKYIAAEK
ncbi:MAG: DUF368 domain-containing protein [Candidatus Saliniplasma sp.]